MTSFPSAKTAWKAKTTSGTGRSSASQRAFTLVEVVIAISVVAILTGLAVPAIDSVQRERLAREPVNRLILLAREVRGRAMTEQRPYQIMFDGEGFRASRFFNPYGGREEAQNLRLQIELMARQQEIAEASKKRGLAMTVEEEVDPAKVQVEDGLRYLEEYEINPELQVSLKFWNETEWVGMSGSEYRRWIFQPSGMCEPMRLKVEADKSFFEVEFHPLTADVKSEKSWVE
jgi:prepilin-type N-terminal cleavage/methylation domain-containing protein